MHSRSRRTLLLALAGASAVALTPGLAAAQAFPNKPIEFVAHTSPGGGTDLFARAISDFLAKEKVFSQSYLIGNRTGGSGTIAMNYIKSKKGDPHFLLTVATGTFMSAIARPDLGITINDFTPIALFAQDPQAIAVRAESKFRSFKEIVEAAKREPNTITAAIASATGTGRIALYLIERETGARFKYVSFKSGGDAVLAVLGGHVDITPENMSEMLPLVESKKMRVLAVTGERRFRQAAEVPTLKEQGFNIVAATGRGFAMPAGVPKEAAATMEAALKRVHASPAYKEYAERNIFEDKYLASAEFAQYLAVKRLENEEFLKVIGILKP